MTDNKLSGLAVEGNRKIAQVLLFEIARIHAETSEGRLALIVLNLIGNDPIKIESDDEVVLIRQFFNSKSEISAKEKRPRIFLPNSPERQQEVRDIMLLVGFIGRKR
jgi:hypothetical protein